MEEHKAQKEENLKMKRQLMEVWFPIGDQLKTYDNLTEGYTQYSGFNDQFKKTYDNLEVGFSITEKDLMEIDLEKIKDFLHYYENSFDNMSIKTLAVFPISSQNMNFFCQDSGKDTDRPC